MCERDIKVRSLRITDAVFARYGSSEVDCFLKDLPDIRFTPQGGAIEIRAALRPSGPIDSGNGRLIPATQPLSSALPWIVVDIKDNGIGIAESELPRIFDRFYQVSDSLTRDHGGIGLGLALVRELVSVLGGAVWVVSKAGMGSTFSFALPYTASSRPSVASRRPSTRRWKFVPGGDHRRRTTDHAGVVRCPSSVVCQPSTNFRVAVLAALYQKPGAPPTQTARVCASSAMLCGSSSVASGNDRGVWDALARGHKFTPPDVLFKKNEDDQVADLAARFGGGGGAA